MQILTDQHCIGRFVSKFTVIMYHYVRNIKNSRYKKIKGLELNLFLEQVKYIKKNFNPITISDLISAYEGNYVLPSKSLLMTFDDAYSDHYMNVYPILKKHGIQGAFYVPAKTVEEAVVLDVNKIHFFLSACESIPKLIRVLHKKFNELKQEYNVKEFEQYYTDLAVANRFDSADVIFIKRLLQVALPEKMRQKICSDLFNEFVKIDEMEFSKELYMNKHQLSHMIDDGMHVGCHGYNHYWWDKLDEDELNQEISLSLRFLESLGENMKHWTACYPYGSSNPLSVNLLKEKGCRLAFTTSVRIADINDDNYLLIPRLDTNDLSKD